MAVRSSALDIVRTLRLGFHKSRRKLYRVGMEYWVRFEYPNGWGVSQQG